MELSDSYIIPDDMLRELGYNNIEELFNDILPREIRFDGKLDIPKIPEKLLGDYLMDRLSRDKVFKPNNIYVGGGVWPVYIPYIVYYIISRSEFLTSYTPYQAEISQGTMQALYEYQSMMAELLDLDVVNSSMYDWSSAAGEALLMACRVKNVNSVLIPDHIPTNRERVIKTYLWGANISYGYLKADEDGNLDIRDLRHKLREGVAGVYLEYPNMYGYIYENLDEAIDAIHGSDALVILGVDPLALPILKPPGELGADIAVGEGQPLGLPMNFGGPLLGIFAVRGEMGLIRNMPGRIIGLTRDIDGDRAFAMILQTREQHIRREKATSNICTNEALSAIATAIYISIIGRDGLIKLSKELLINSHKLHEMLLNQGFENKYDLPFHREFALKPNRPYETGSLINYLVSHDILFGYLDKDAHVISVNEYHTPEDFTHLIELIGGYK